MLSLKLILLFSCCYIAYGSESSEELEALLSSPFGTSLLKEAFKAAYDDDKLDVISTLIEDKNEFLPNATIIGSQNIYGPNGDIVEIRTIELHLPEILKNKDVISKIEEEEDDDDDILISEIKELFDIVSKIGLSIEVTAEEFDKEGNLDSKAYIDKDILYGYAEGIHLFNKTVEVASSKEVYEKVKELEAKGTVGVHKFDVNGQFLSEESKVIPEYIVSVLEEDGDVDQEILEEAKKALGIVFLKYQNNKDEVPSKLSEYLSSKYPAIEFNVFSSEPKAWYINKDFKIILQYDLVDWDSSSVILYTIFGLNKDVNPNKTDTAAS